MAIKINRSIPFADGVGHLFVGVERRLIIKLPGFQQIAVFCLCNQARSVCTEPSSDGFLNLFGNLILIHSRRSFVFNKLAAFTFSMHSANRCLVHTPSC